MRNHQDGEIDWERLDRFVRDIGSPDERAALAAWVDSDPNLGRLAESMRTIGNRSADKGVRPDAHLALHKVQIQLGMGRPAIHAPRPARWLRSTRRVALERVMLATGIAATLAIVAVSMIRRDAPTAPVAAAPAPREFSTEPGRRASIELADGSRVVLSAGSHLTVAGDFGQMATRRRELSLTGEAYFSVRHDSTRPFIVRTKFGTVEDLGTEFVLNTYPEMHGMRLAVRQGRVEVRDGDSVAILTRGDLARVSSDGHFSVERKRDVSLFFGAASGELMLRATTVRDAVPLLERWFGIRVKLTDRALLSRRISATFHEEAAVSAMAVIALALDSSAEWNANEVTIAPRVDADVRK